MRFDIFTLFPDAFEWLLGQRSFRKSGEEGAEFTLRDYRTWSPLKGGRVDDSPYGGGSGMVIRVDVVDGRAHLWSLYEGRSLSRPLGRRPAG
ncbi:MAG: tRNA (guanosine(37)-N1)-methyltransferase TrmD, partial [Solirubrobacterales bacterium]